MSLRVNLSTRSLPAKVAEPQAGMDNTHGSMQVCELQANRLTRKGWALREEKKPAPFVLFAYRARGRTAIPFAVAPTGNSTPGFVLVDLDSVSNPTYRQAASKSALGR